MRKVLLILVSIVTFIAIGTAQDIHFSDFYSSPLTLNSAMTGEFVGNYRYIANYRWQYGTVTVPYQTFSISADVKNNASRRKATPIGYGFILNYDFTGDSKYTSYQFGIPISYHYLFPSKKTRVSYGIIPQLIFNQISFSDLQFPDQFIYDKFYQSVSSKDKIPYNKLHYINLSSGLNFTFKTSLKSSWEIGGNIANITRPSLSFYNDNSSRLERRFSTMSRFQYRVTSTFDLVPNAIFQFQGKLREYQYGAKGIYYLDNITIPSMDFGAWYRSRNSDALILHMGFNLSGYLIGFNYDINLSKLSTASNGIGAVEFSLLYVYNRSLMPHKREAMKCPTHL